MVVSSLAGLAGCSGTGDPEKWSAAETDKWFEKIEWLNGWTAKPDPSVDRKALAVSYFRNMERWNSAFSFLKENDLSALELKRYDIDGDNLYVAVSEYLTKNPEEAYYEAHRKYIDIQYVVSGKELIGITPLSMKNEIIESYDPERDIEFFTVSSENNLSATPDRFFIFFPGDAHRPGLRDGENAMVKKIVVKVWVD
ncbi:MAG: YhcH/YjgK/YiaL family protein [Bacteroidales bacterium]|nr:YhcH/YjgK/YiaL family protein [Bacteroidales bacterium]